MQCILFKLQKHKQWLVVDCKQNLGRLVERVDSRLVWLRESLDVLCEMLLNSSEEGDSGDSSIKMRMLLDLEEHLRLLQTSGKAVHLKKTIIKHLPKYCVEKRIPTEVEDRLHMALESTDSVWFLGKYPEGSVWLLQTIRIILKRKYPIASQVMQHQQPDSSQLMTMFWDRLHQWQHHADTIKQLHQDLTDMLKSWPEHRVVRTHQIRTKLTGWSESSGITFD